MTESNDSERPTGEKLWDATRKTFHSATFHAGRYKRLVQKKIDLNAIHKKISTLHADLGRLIDECRSGGGDDILQRDEVQDLFHKLDGLRHAAATLEEEIDVLKAEEPAEEPPETEEKPPETADTDRDPRE